MRNAVNDAMEKKEKNEEWLKEKKRKIREKEYKI